MPIVPSYNNSAPAAGIERAAIPGARLGVQASPEAFGAGVARASQDVAQVSLNIAQREQEKAQQVRLQDWSNRLAEHENTLLNDPQTGALQKRGKEAFGIADPTLQSYDTFANGLDKEVTNEDERASLRNLVADRRNGVQSAVMRHIGGEMQRYDTEAFGSGISASQTAALTYYDDAHRVDAEAYRQLTSIEQYAQRNGLPPEWVQDQQSKAQSTTYAGAIGRMLDKGDDLAAKDALGRWGSALTGEDADRIDRAMKETSSRSASRTLSDEITGKAPDLQAALADLESRKVSDVNVYDKTRERIQEHFSLQQAAQRDHEDGLMSTATDLLDSSKGAGLAEDIVPPQIWSQLSTARREQLKRYQARDIPEFNQDVSDLQRMVGTPAFEHVRLTDYVGKIRSSQLVEFGKLQAEQVQKGTSAPKVADAISNQNIIGNAFHTLGFDEDKQQNSDDALDLRGKYQAAINQAMVVNGGKPLADSDKVAIAKALSADYVTQVVRAAYSPLRLFSPTASESHGPLYKQSPDVISSQMPIPGTRSERTGVSFTHADVDTWVRMLQEPDAAKRQASIDHLLRMKQGIASDGSYDPAVAAGYQVIRDALAAAQAAQADQP